MLTIRDKLKRSDIWQLLCHTAKKASWGRCLPERVFQASPIAGRPWGRLLKRFYKSLSPGCHVKKTKHCPLAGANFLILQQNPTPKYVSVNIWGEIQAISFIHSFSLKLPTAALRLMNSAVWALVVRKPNELRGKQSEVTFRLKEGSNSIWAVLSTSYSIGRKIHTLQMQSWHDHTNLAHTHAHTISVNRKY